MPLAPLVVALLQVTLPVSSPPSGDTLGYWQQRADYRIVATLDEPHQTLHATGTLVYVNHSPDTLRELYIQQLLNAFRPGSRWSAADEREGRYRFQRLAEPNSGFERFTAVPTINGTAVAVSYPYAPDSTIARLTLPAPLAPGDSIGAAFAWDARPSATIYRRQGRKGRHYDFAQWYPKALVYDRRGWAFHPFVPNGEMYGEFGTFDVTLILPSDQIVGATGVPVAGDPGWARSLKWGEVHLGSDAYGTVDTTLPSGLAPNMRAVRFLARQVHHFAWSVDPEYRYEGSLYRGTIPVHALYLPSDTSIAHGVFVKWNERALAWLEKIYGPYGYPQLTGLIRLDPGATEFPMMATYGRASAGTVVHEVGHIYTYGMLANNEWRSGWMDEGLTSYQSSWLIGATPQDRWRAPASVPAVKGYRAHAAVPNATDRGQVELFDVDLRGRADPLEPPAGDYREFVLYQEAVYSRAEMMFGMLRDLIGDSAFATFLHTYYARWQFKHVDELAMRRAAGDASGQDLGWFFAQWVHHTGLVDYALGDVDVAQDSTGWTTRVTVDRRDVYRHAMPVGVHTLAGWELVRADDSSRTQRVTAHTADKPDSVRLDPHRSTVDWDRRNGSDVPVELLSAKSSRLVFDWPFLDQSDRDRNIVAWLPYAWYTDPGGVTPAVRFRTNYEGQVDRRELGVAVAVRAPDGSGSATQVNGWAKWENPRLPFADRPLMGAFGSAAALDGIAKVELRQRWNTSPFVYANGSQQSLTAAIAATIPYDARWLDTARWENASVLDASVRYAWRDRMPGKWAFGGLADAGVVWPRMSDAADRAFVRLEGEVRRADSLGAKKRFAYMLRAFGGTSSNAPLQRSIGLSTEDVTGTYDNPFVRGAGALFARPDVHFLTPGGAGLRGYSSLARAKSVASANGELALALNTPHRGSIVPRVQLTVFGDAAYASLFDAPEGWLGDAGAGLLVRATVYDRAITLRVDVPFYVSRPELGVGSDAGPDRLAMRYTFAFADLW